MQKLTVEIRGYKQYCSPKSHYQSEKQATVDLVRRAQLYKYILFPRTGTYSYSTSLCDFRRPRSEKLLIATSFSFCVLKYFTLCQDRPFRVYKSCKQLTRRRHSEISSRHLETDTNDVPHTTNVLSLRLLRSR